MDFNADKHIEKVIRELCDTSSNPGKEEWNYWKHITKKMLRHMSVMGVISYVLAISEEQAEEFEYPFLQFDEIVKKPLKVYGKSKADEIIKASLKITEVAKNYGLKVKKNKSICPFHPDTDPSLSFSDAKNVFFCHGCHTKGDLITFIKKMEGLNGDKKRSN